MGKFIVVAIVAAVVGAAAVYGWVVYTESEPPAVDDIVAKMQGDAADPDPREPTAAVESEDTTHPTIAATVRPTRAPQDAPTDTPLALSTAAPTAEPTVAAPTEREVVVDAFASCGGQYTGNDRDFRARAADSAIADGRQTVADIRALVEEHCGGVLRRTRQEDVGPTQTPTVATTQLVTATPRPMATVTPTRAAARKVAPTPIVSDSRFDGFALEQEIHRLINAERTRSGQRGLRWDDRLGDIARSHSDDMASQDYFDHVNLKGESPTDRGNNADYPCVKQLSGGAFSYGLAENIWYGWEYSSYTYGTFGTRYDWMSQTELAQQAVASWMGSSGHRGNILTSKYDQTGIGVGFGVSGGKKHAVYLTQVFC